LAKFGRTYVLKIATDESGSSLVEIGMPFSCEFDVMRSINGSANTATFTIYNLAPQTRKLLYKDPFNIEKRAIQFFAGYDDKNETMLPLLFNGFVKQAGSVRQGTEFQTVIEAYDGGFAMTEGQAEVSVSAGQKVGDVLKKLMENLPAIAGATIGDGYDDVTKRGQVIFGNPVDHLRMATRNRFFIDNNRAYILADNEILPGDIGKIDATTGLIGTPKKNATVLEVGLIFEPRVTICQALELESITFPEANGTFKVIEISHRGMISPQVAGSVITNLKLLIPADSELLKLVNP
jgi:hypothetical protein